MKQLQAQMYQNDPLLAAGSSRADEGVPAIVHETRQSWAHSLQAERVQLIAEGICSRRRLFIIMNQVCLTGVWDHAILDGLSQS